MTPEQQAAEKIGNLYRRNPLDNYYDAGSPNCKEAESIIRDTATKPYREALELVKKSFKEYDNAKMLVGIYNLMTEDKNDTEAMEAVKNLPPRVEMLREQLAAYNQLKLDIANYETLLKDQTK